MMFFRKSSSSYLSQGFQHRGPLPEFHPLVTVHPPACLHVLFWDPPGHAKSVEPLPYMHVHAIHTRFPGTANVHSMCRSSMTKANSTIFCSDPMSNVLLPSQLGYYRNMSLLPGLNVQIRLGESKCFFSGTIFKHPLSACQWSEE